MTDDPHICPECHREFQTRSALISHSKTHPNVTHDETAPAPTMELPPMPEPTPMAEFLGIHNIAPPSGAAPVMPDPSTTNTVGHIPVTILPESTSMAEYLAASAPALRANVQQQHDDELAQYFDVVVRLKKLKHYGDLPEIKRATAGSAGIDLAAANYQDIVVGINQWKLIPTGLCIEVPLGWVAKIAPRSGLAANEGITVLNTPGIIDSDYRGEIKINLVNNTTKKFVVKRGMRIAQMLIERSPVVKLEWVEELSETARGAGGFGSTGR